MRISLAFLFVSMAAAAVAQTRCEDLTRLNLPRIAVRSAVTVAANSFRPPGARPDSAPYSIQQFCRVVAVVRPELDFELWLPERWNRKYEAVGNGGLAGTIPYAAMIDPLGRGYATSSTNTGHINANGGDATWALGHMDRVINYGQRGVHEMAVASKALVRAYYGADPEHSYFNGCSYGGKQALTEVQKYPDDFDGVIAGDPANWTTRHTTANHIWIAQAVDGDGWLSPSKVQLLADSVNAACDMLDSIRDGVLADPRKCHFDPGTLQCKNGERTSCLTAAQVDAVRKVWSGPRDSEGQLLYPGIEPGGEAGPGGWLQWVTGDKAGAGGHAGLGVPFMKYIAYENPDWDYRTFRFNSQQGLESDMEYVEDKLGRIFDSVDPDLRPFRANGGKLIQYHGWSDPDIPPANSINYFESVVHALHGDKVAGLRDTKEFYRLFLVPGMQHCGGGPGTSRFDMLTALEQWVEDDKAPEQVIGSHVTNGQVDRTRPICAYPMQAKYKGTGSTDEAANFSCALP
ncbi:MAG: tannase/feruloyl esterase family alpha/beta hydrolase [Bryobacteraceae bacterium]